MKPSRRDLTTTVIMVLLGCANLVDAGIDFAQSQWWDGVMMATFGLVWMNFLSIRRNWIGVGYLRGRSTVLASMNEAMRRGLTVQQFVMAEVERDLVDLRKKPRNRNPDRTE